MYLDLPYGNNSQNFDTEAFSPPLRISGRFKCDFPRPLDSFAISAKIVNGIKNLKHLFEAKRILTVVNDGYRRTPTSSVLRAIWDSIKDGEFIVATGSHRRSTEAELESIFGDYLSQIKPRLLFHDCYDNDLLENLGTTSRGTPVSINKAIIEADLIFTINSVEPHFFAGFTGGRKSLIPGLAGFETIKANHRLAKDIDSRTLNLQTNPLHLDLEESTQFLGDKPILTVQCVTDRDGRIIDLYSGELRMAFYQACESAQKAYTIEVPKQYDIVIANCEPPLDVNLYQLQKAQEHGGRMVKDGGVLIVMGACREGIGSVYFMELARKYPNPELALTDGINDDSFGIHKLIKTARQLRKFQIFYVTTLDDEEVRRVYFKSFKDIAAALKSAVKTLEKEGEIAILEDAGYSVPVIKT
jgi:nickel-dependent lactate racemase